jgi:hypothetical protein
MIGRFGSGRLWPLALLLLLLPAIAFASANYLKPGFSLPADRRASPLVLYPDLFVGSLDSRGEQIANPDWTESAHANLRDTLSSGAIGRAVELRFMTRAEAEASPAVEQIWSAFRALTNDIILRVPQGTPIGQAARRGRYDYSIGPELAARIRAAHGEADFLLLILMHDGYATSGQVISSVASAMLSPPWSPGRIRRLPPHYGNAMLVDLRDGAVVWFHGDGAFGGDLRNREGAARRLEQAMSNFPIATSRRPGR